MVCISLIGTEPHIYIYVYKTEVYILSGGMLLIVWAPDLKQHRTSKVMMQKLENCWNCYVTEMQIVSKPSKISTCMKIVSKFYVPIFHCERRELPSQSYGTPKKRNKILNIDRRTILYKTFSYSLLILNWFQTWTGPAKTLGMTFWSRFSEAYFSVPVGDTSFYS